LSGFTVNNREVVIMLMVERYSRMNIYFLMRRCIYYRSMTTGFQPVFFYQNLNSGIEPQGKEKSYK